MIEIQVVFKIHTKNGIHGNVHFQMDSVMRVTLSELIFALQWASKFGRHTKYSPHTDIRREIYSNYAFQKAQFIFHQIKLACLEKWVKIFM